MNAWYFRKIRHGRVKIKGEWYYLDDSSLKYDGRLDGMVYLFYTYPDYPLHKGLAVIWGSKQEAEAKTEEESKHLWDTRPDVINGIFHWSSWRTKENALRKEALRCRCRMEDITAS